MKHIESIQPEVAAGELSRLLVADADATASAALSRLLHDWTGCDIPQTATTPQSDVDELVPLAVSILRRHWQTPLTCLGDGNTPMSLADLMRQTIGDRVQGNEALGILPANDNIPIAINTLLNRKISNASQNDGIEDGVSLARLLSSQECLNKITELIDDNKDWIMDKDLPSSLTASITKATFGFKELEINTGKVTQFFVNSNLEELHLPYAKEIYVRIGKGYGDVLRFLQNSTNLRVLDFPKLETLYLTGGDGFAHGLWNIKGEDTMVFPSLKSFYNDSNANTIYNWTDCRVLKFPVMEKTKVMNTTWLANMPSLEELYMPVFVGFNGAKTSNPSMIGSCPMLRKVVFGVLIDNMKAGTTQNSMLFNNCPQVIHFEIGQNTNVSLVLNLWIPTMALRTDTTAEDYVDLREDMSLANNLEQFLYNFQTYIADRLADKTGQTALTLTLSAEVYAALEQQDGQTILATLTNKNWTVAQA